MSKKLIILFLSLFCLATVAGFAFDNRGRLHALNILDVEKNRATLLRTNKCRGCYLAYVKLAGIDLSYSDLGGANLIGASLGRSTLYGANLSGAKIAGANFSGAQWTDGSICQRGSIGRCIKKQKN